MTADEQGMTQNLERFMDVLTKDFPSALPLNETNPWANIDFEGVLMSFMGVFFIQISLSLWWTVHLYYMVMEKSKNLRFNLTSMGASWIVYHISHILTAFVIMTISVFVAVTTGYIMVLPFYTHSNYVCLFIIHFCFGAGTLGIMMLICSVVSNQRVARTFFILQSLNS
jgi:magnesium-transporting ATPase (P-type)